MIGELTPLLIGSMTFAYVTGIAFLVSGIYLSWRQRRPHPLLLVSISAIAISWIEAPYDWAMYAQFPSALPRMPSWWPMNATWGGLPASVPIGYISYFVLPALIGAALGNRAAAKFGWRRPQALLGVGFAVGFVWAFCFNALLGARLGVFHYGRVIPGLAIFQGTKYQYPVYDAIAMALQMMVFAYLLGRTDAQGRNVIESWANRRSKSTTGTFAALDHRGRRRRPRPLSRGVRAAPDHEAPGRRHGGPDRGAVPRRAEPAVRRRGRRHSADPPHRGTRRRTLTSIRPTSAVRYDPYDADIDDDPYEVWRRLQDEAPLYWNEEHQFWAVSRWDDVRAALLDWDTYRSGRGTVLDIVKAGVEIPAGDPAVRGSTDPRCAPRLALARVHAPADARPRAAGAEIHRAGARRARRSGGVRHHLRARRRDPLAHDRIPLRHPRGRPGRVPPDHRRSDRHRRRTDLVRPVDARLGPLGAGGLCRVAFASPVRRPDDRAAAGAGR